jgi:hypothetical protein
VLFEAVLSEPVLFEAVLSVAEQQDGQKTELRWY